VAFGADKPSLTALHDSVKSGIMTLGILHNTFEFANPKLTTA
jgi:hypothetical protein